MRYGIFSDVHSNLEALEAVLGYYRNEAIDKYLCVGDIVGYGANPRECLDALRRIISVCVAGNHDWALTGKFSLAFFNPIAKAALISNAKELSKVEKDYLDNLELIFFNNDLTLVHGTLNEAQNFNYLTSKGQALGTFRLMKSNICFVGHTHIPQVLEFDAKAGVCQLAADNLKIKKSKKYIVNVGSVGQPRDSDPRASFAIFDTDREEILIKRVAYDVKKAQEKILGAGLPDFLASRLSIGQ